MDKETVYFTVDEYFNGFGIQRITDEKLKKTDCYYIDPEEEKYIFVCKVFTHKSQLIMNWESFQDEDIALYMQQKKYANNDIRWDMYFVIIYIGDDQFEIEEFLAIEKDKFCCKKLVLHAKEEKELHKQLNNKLPLTKDYFKLGDNSEVFTDSGFLKLLNEKNGLKNDVLSLQLLKNLTEEKDELFRKLLKHELDFIRERKE